MSPLKVILAIDTESTVLNAKVVYIRILVNLEYMGKISYYLSFYMIKTFTVTIISFFSIYDNILQCISNYKIQKIYITLAYIHQSVFICSE